MQALEVPEPRGQLFGERPPRQGQDAGPGRQRWAGGGQGGWVGLVRVPVKEEQDTC